jgi:Ca2+-binding RTX toxin-like protein
MSPALHEGGGVYEAHPGAAGGDGLDTGRGKRGCLGSQRDRHQWSGHLEGTNGDDISGSDANDVLWGGGGRDNLLGGTGGNDIVLSGNEHRFFSRGDKNLVGGSANDTVIGGLHKGGPSTSS